MKAGRLILGVLVFSLFVVVLCLRKVPLDKVGVVTDNFSGGVEQKDRDPGYIWIWPGMQTLSLWDPTVQAIHLERTRSRDARVHVRGKDQYTTHLDITVLFRIRRDEQGRTYAWTVAKKFGSKEKAEEIALRNANKTIWEIMSDLATEDFYDSNKRSAKAELARERLDQSLREEGLSILSVLVRKIDYDSGFETKLLEKQLLEQDQLLQSSLARAEREKQITEKIEKEAEAAVKRIAEERAKDIRTLQADKEKKLREIEGDVGLYTTRLASEAARTLKEKTAEGQLLADRARAKGEEAINQAYFQSGGEFLLAKKMVESLEFGTIEINTNAWNPFDVRETLERLMGTPATPPSLPVEKR